MPWMPSASEFAHFQASHGGAVSQSAGSNRLSMLKSLSARRNTAAWNGAYSRRSWRAAVLKVETCLFLARADTLASLDLVGAAETALLAPGGFALATGLLRFRCTGIARAGNQTGIHAASARLLRLDCIAPVTILLRSLSSSVCSHCSCQVYARRARVRSLISWLFIEPQTPTKRGPEMG